MRIAIVTDSFIPAFTGVTTSVCQVLDRLATTGHEAIVLCPGPAPSSYRGFPVRAVRGVTVGGLRLRGRTAELERHLADFAPDVVHVASLQGLGTRGLNAADHLGIPSVAIFQTDLPGRLAHPASKSLRRSLSVAGMTLAPSTAAMQLLSDHDVPRVGHWARGVDTTVFHPSRRTSELTRELRQCLAPNGQTIVGYVGRLAPEKELHRLAELADLPGVSLAIVGDGRERDRLEQLMPRASFLGHRQGMELAGTYAAFDLFVHPGRHATFGQTLQEAMASGLPVVAPAAGGPLDIVRPGVTGLLFDPDRCGALRETVGGLVADSDMRARMGRSSRTKIELRNWPAAVDELVGIYQRVTTRRRLRVA
ncbi:MAG TPA: glycosyltransferase family 1 protein [Flexivirga sp.]|uniref:glycosyltransferase family 4 protein n=1 Tax=Flexivirga sp. TaxID=1962927 RepID=UPI002C33FA62|nr:glycosyltransferase family 1 protein [Flexivirga sp.]HWC23416.1 glycosyltransferase family 1 protein [Flexivirga sp.]